MKIFFPAGSNGRTRNIHHPQPPRKRRERRAEYLFKNNVKDSTISQERTSCLDIFYFFCSSSLSFWHEATARNYINVCQIPYFPAAFMSAHTNILCASLSVRLPPSKACVNSGRGKGRNASSSFPIKFREMRHRRRNEMEFDKHFRTNIFLLMVRAHYRRFAPKNYFRIFFNSKSHPFITRTTSKKEVPPKKASLPHLSCP